MSDLTLTGEANSILESNSTTIIRGEEININKLDPDVWDVYPNWENKCFSIIRKKMAFSAMKIARNNYDWKLR